MATATAAVPVLEALITLTGQARTGGAPPTPVSGISFEGLIFEHATWLLPSTGEGYIDNQVHPWRERRKTPRPQARMTPPPRISS